MEGHDFSSPNVCFLTSVQIAVRIYRTNLNWLTYDRSLISAGHCGYIQSETTKLHRFCGMISEEECMFLEKNDSMIRQWCLTTDWSSRTSFSFPLRSLSLEVDHDLYQLKQAWLRRLALQIPWAHNFIHVFWAGIAWHGYYTSGNWIIQTCDNIRHDNTQNNQIMIISMHAAELHMSWRLFWKLASCYSWNFLR